VQKFNGPFKMLKYVLKSLVSYLVFGN